MLRKSVLAFVLVSVASPALAAQVKVKAGTPVIVTPDQTISSENVSGGDTISGTVVTGVKIDGKTVIEGGAGAKLSISRVEKSGSIGEGGALQVKVDSVYSVDGQRIPVSGSKSVRGEDKTTESVAVGAILCPLALLMEGDKAELSSNTEIRAMTQTESMVRVEG